MNGSGVYGGSKSIMEEVAENVYRIGVPLPKNPLKLTNSYFIRGEDSDLLIDTGFRCEESRQALRTELQKLGADLDRLDVLVTHVHSDHSGLSGEFAGRSRHVYLSRKDMDYLNKIFCGRHLQMTHRRFVSEGFPPDLLGPIETKTPSIIYSLQYMDHRFVPVDDGDIIEVGTYRLRCISVPGHSPGNCMYWAEEQKIMFTGDHILFNITPNITAFVDEEDSLGSYLDSLRRVWEFPVKLALPGHRMPGNYHARIEELLSHHYSRLQVTLSVVTQFPNCSAYDIAGHMTWHVRADSWDTFPGGQKWYAVGECLSHLDYLRRRNFIARAQKGETWKYWALCPSIDPYKSIYSHVASK